MGYIIRFIVGISYQVFSMLIIIRCLISWFPGVNIYKEPVKSIFRITDYILDPIRNFMLKRGLITVIDISPVIAIFIMGIAVNIVNYIF